MKRILVLEIARTMTGCSLSVTITPASGSGVATSPGTAPTCSTISRSVPDVESVPVLDPAAQTRHRCLAPEMSLTSTVHQAFVPEPQLDAVLADPIGRTRVATVSTYAGGKNFAAGRMIPPGSSALGLGMLCHLSGRYER